MESPIPILPLPTPDAETEKLIRMKDEEVGGEQGRSHGGWAGRGEGPGWVVEPGWWAGSGGGARLGAGQAPPSARSHRPLPLLPRPQLRRMQEMLQKMKLQMQDQ